MKYLRKTLLGIGLILILQLLKKLFDKLFPEAIIFHHSALTCLQVFALIWLFVSLLSLLTARGKPVTQKNAWKNLLIVLFIFAVPETLAAYWLYHPSRIPSFLVPVFRDYYGGVRRNIIQFNPDCSVYDSSLFYTLKPSSRFIFDNYEFSDTYFTNKRGLRDDDNSLVKPDIICLGDSFTMGWGVQQNETFAELLSRQWGKKVLNAGVSSYGTVRELKNLYRLDTSGVQYIIIQYSLNDATENAEFIQQNYSLTLSPEKIYNSSVNLHYWNKLWFPGRHFITMSKMYAHEKIAGFLSAKKNNVADSVPYPLNQLATNFADILMHSAINFKKTRVLAIELNDRETTNDVFLNKVKTLIATPPYAGYFNNNLIMVPVADTLNKEDFYILDEHLRPSGHRKIAQRLSSYMRSGKQLGSFNESGLRIQF